jgi:protocatechuate 3,4-dioxygenase beta subunit
MKRRNLLKLGTLSAMIPVLPYLGKANNCDPTTGDIEGPFYTPNAPVRNKISPEGVPGTVLFLTGTVYHNDCLTPLPNANLDVWQADDGGAYDNVGFDYRGKFNTDGMGNYAMETVLPGKYLNGSSYRPRHIHLKVGATGADLITTQLYFEGDTDIPGDPWASSDSAAGRIIPLTEDTDGNLHGVFDISLNLTPVIDSTHQPEDNAGNRIIHIFPNPVSEAGQVQVLMNITAKLKVEILALNGQKVRLLFNGDKPRGTHTFKFDNLRNEGIKLNSGIYIIQMSIDDQLLDAKRFILL